MFTEDMTKEMMDLFTNPLFKRGFFDFFLKMQQDGIEAARKLWDNSAQKQSLVPNATEMYERMIDFYIILGFVPRVKYDEMAKENKNLKTENKFLRDAMRELQQNLFKDGGEKAQQIWNDSIDKQLDLHKEIAKNFFEIFGQLNGVKT
jgi:regulator of replication initiation timing